MPEVNLATFHQVELSSTLGLAESVVRRTSFPLVPVAVKLVIVCVFPAPNLITEFIPVIFKVPIVFADANATIEASPEIFNSVKVFSEEKVTVLFEPVIFTFAKVFFPAKEIVLLLPEKVIFL